MFKYLTLLFLLFSAAEVQSQVDEEEPVEIIDEDSNESPAAPRIRKYPSRLWEITGNGLKQPSYLYGTMHVSKKLAFNLGDTFYRALQSVDVVALELAIDSWLSNIGRNRDDYYFGFNRYGRYGYDYGGFYKNAMGFEGSDLASLLNELGSEDYMSNFLLYRQGYQSPNYSEKTYVDLYIHQVGKKLNKFCTGLEDFEVSRKMVSRSSWRDRTFPRERKYGGGYYYGYGEDPTEKAYREGDLDMIDSLEKRDNPDIHFLKWMLYERNKVMADQIEQIVKSKKLFAAVGCAHLPGDSGVIEFLRRKGFKLTPIYDNAGDYAFKQKQKLESTTTSVTFKKYVSHNGELSFELPGVPLDRSVSNTEDIFYADVANGAYYVLKKIPFYGTVKGISQQKLLKQLDSALYENIPGDITARSKTSVNGFPALDVSNRTKTGETQRHLYIVMPNHVWYIKLSAAGSYAEGKEARDFFKSINLQANPVKWNEYAPECGGYKVNWPTPVVRNKLSFDTSTDFRSHTTLEFTDNKGDFYFLRYLELPYYGFDQDTFHMHQIATNFAYYNKGKIENIDFRFIKGHQAMQTSIRFKDKDLYLHMLLAAEEAGYYTTGVFSENKRPPANFLSSFEFIPFKYKYPVRQNLDPLTGLSYKRANWSQIELQFKRINEEKEIARKEITYPDSDYSGLEEYFPDTLSEDVKYVLPIVFPTGEEVNAYVYYNGRIAPESNWAELKKRGILIKDSISFARYKKYNDSVEHVRDSTDEKRMKVTYWMRNKSDYLLDTLYFRNGMIYNDIIQMQKGTSWCDFTRNIISEQATCRLMTRYDRERGMSAVVKEVIESFEIKKQQKQALDSVAFGELMVKLLSSADSTDLFRAQDYRYYLRVVPKKFNDTLLTLLKKFDQNALYGKIYSEMLIEKLSQDVYLPLIGFYMDKFRRGGDTSEIQAQMLVNLGNLKNSTALDSLLFWLLEETPLAPENSYNSYLYSSIIYTAYDSLKLWNSKYSQLLPLKRYKEYEDAIMSLGITMLDSQLIDRNIFEPIIPELALSFRDDLKRKKAKSARTSDYGYRYNNSYSNQKDIDKFEYGTSGNTLFGFNYSDYSGDYGDYEGTEYYDEDYSLNKLINPRYNLSQYQSVNRSWSSMRYHSYSPYYYNSSNSLYDKARILVLYYNQNPEVAKRLKRVYTLQEKEDKMLYLDLFMKNKIRIPDSMYRHYLGDKDCQYGFIQMLKNHQKLDSIPKSYYNEKNLANLFMYYHHFNKKDTVVFLGKKEAPIEKEKGNMYFYKHKNKEQKSDESWEYSYVWIGDRDTLETMKVPRYYKFNNAMNKKMSVKEMMDMEISKIEYWKHPQWQALEPDDNDENSYYRNYERRWK